MKMMLKDGWVAAFHNVGTMGPWMCLAVACVFLTPLSCLAGDESSTASAAVSNDTVSAEETATASEPTDYGSPAGKSKKAKSCLSARLKVEYDYRKQGSAKDSDIYGRFYGSGRDLKDKHLDVYVSARLHTDLDRPASTSLADDPYRSLDDANGVTENRLLQLYGDVHSQNKRLAFRAGRQYIEIADYLHLDGAQLLLNENEKFGGRVYLGHPVSYYASASGDYAAGVSFVGRPWEGNRSRLTLSRYSDDSEQDADQNYYLDIQQQLSESWRTRGQVSLLNGDFRMGRLDGFYYSPSGETDFSIGGSYWGTFDAKTRAYSPLYNTLGGQDAYYRVYARLTQQIAPDWMISPGASLRLADSGYNSYNNRDYENYDVTLIFAPNPSFSSSVALEYWSVGDSDSFLGLSGEVRYRRDHDWEISGGASYAQYTYDSYSDISYTVDGGQTIFSENGTIIEESPFVYTYFINGKWKITHRLTLRLQFDIEDDQSASDMAYMGRGSVEVRF